MLVTASVDYRLLDIVQHPISILTPLVLGLASVALIITWRAGQLPLGEGEPALGTFVADLPGHAGLGMALVGGVFVVDRVWIEKLDLPLPRFAGRCRWCWRPPGPGALSSAAWSRDRLAGLTPYLLVGGLAAVYLLDCLTLRITDTLRNPLYVLMLALLGIIFVIGQVSGGSQRWLGAGTVQPSELSKILIVIVLAKFLADREEDLERFSTVLASLGVVAVPMLLIYLQPDLGTALTLVAIWVAMMWMAGMRFRHLLILGAGGRGRPAAGLVQPGRLYARPAHALHQPRQRSRFLF